jgi:osmotically inducible lipoprotein OsmB
MQSPASSVSQICTTVITFLKTGHASSSDGMRSQLAHLTCDAVRCCARLRDVPKDVCSELAVRASAQMGREISAMIMRHEGEFMASSVLATLAPKAEMMNSLRILRFNAVAAAMVLALSACAGMSSQDKSTAIGAGAGAVGGAVLTGGSAVGTVGGAAVGGIIGHEIGETRK